MIKKGTCLLTYLPLRKEAKSSSEMLTCLVFGESYDVIQESEQWLLVEMHFDGYQGWISNGSYSEFLEMGAINDEVFVEFFSKQNKLLIPCGAEFPKSNEIELNGLLYAPVKALKNKHHLNLNLRLQKTAISFLNTPYLWGGRTFMGIDCSGLVQMVYKACGIHLKRDTSQQILEGELVEFENRTLNDVIFFSAIQSSKVSHVGILLDAEKVIHAGPSVRIDNYNSEVMLMNGEAKYKVLEIRRFI